MLNSPSRLRSCSFFNIIPFFPMGLVSNWRATISLSHVLWKVWEQTILDLEAPQIVKNNSVSLAAAAALAVQGVHRQGLPALCPSWQPCAACPHQVALPSARTAAQNCALIKRQTAQGNTNLCTASWMLLEETERRNTSPASEMTEELQSLS